MNGLKTVSFAKRELAKRGGVKMKREFLEKLKSVSELSKERDIEYGKSYDDASNITVFFKYTTKIDDILREMSEQEFGTFLSLVWTGRDLYERRNDPPPKEEIKDIFASYRKDAMRWKNTEINRKYTEEKKLLHFYLEKVFEVLEWLDDEN